ncbi:MAG: ABC transporter ATP-binding protein [Bacilli bacterium]|nr:ABC transporter ATP-binding protein [Bacilli bacterium]MDD4076627.1 ABC transporter ATP-binding protein [Bacilli bacterium]MDD4388168.1 ABC transporter ATP-binding protein [Bacilli bacterium]
MDKHIIEIKNLTKKYGTLTALHNVNLKLPAGKIIGLMGPNGSGKTTFLKILANLLMTYEGEVLINGFKPGIETKKIISYLPDCNYLSEKWNANDAIEFFNDFYDDFNPDQARVLVNRLQINPDQKFRHLSKGTKEKLQLVMVLSRKAQIYLFDEPIAGVDPAAREFIFELILENYNKDGTIIVSTHLISDVENIVDYAIFLKNGTVFRFDEAESIRSETGLSLNDYFKEEYRC